MGTVAVLVVPIFVLLGIRMGIVRTLATLAGIFAGFWAARNFSEPVFQLLVGMLGASREISESSLQLLRMTVPWLVGIGGFGVVATIGDAVAGLLDRIWLGPLDKIVGGIGGLCAGIVLWLWLRDTISGMPDLSGLLSLLREYLADFSVPGIGVR